MSETSEGFNPLELVVIWYTHFQPITKKQISSSMKTLFGKLPSYQTDISPMFQDKEELSAIGPYMIVNTFHRLRQNEAIIFDEKNNRYIINEKKYPENLSPTTELFIFIPNNMDNYIESYFQRLNNEGLLKDQLIDGIKALKLLWEAQKQGKKYVSVSTSTEAPLQKEDASIFKIKFNPVKFVNETGDYDNVYQILKTNNISKLVSKIEMTPENVKKLEIPGLEVDLYSTEE